MTAFWACLHVLLGFSREGSLKGWLGCRTCNKTNYWSFACWNRGDDLPKMGLLMVVLSLIFMSDHVITECKYKNRLHPFLFTISRYPHWWTPPSSLKVQWVTKHRKQEQEWCCRNYSAAQKTLTGLQTNLPWGQRFLSGMAFSIGKVIHASCQSRSWYVCETNRLTSHVHDFVNSKRHARKKPVLKGKTNLTYWNLTEYLFLKNILTPTLMKPLTKLTQTRAAAIAYV